MRGFLGCALRAALGMTLLNFQVIWS